MLRNHCGWAWRLFVAFLLPVLFHCSTVRGGPLIPVPPPVPVTPPAPPVSTYVAPTTYSISGYVFVDSLKNGTKLPGELGISGVSVELFQYSPSNLLTPLSTLTTTTTSSGYYDFTGLQTGDVYTVQEIQPFAFNSTVNSLGYFLGSTGGTLAAPSGVNGNPANGVSNPSLDSFSDILLPSPTGPFAPNSKGGVYSAINYNFGDFPVTPIGGGGLQPVTPGVPVTTSTGSLNLSMAPPANDRFLAVSSGSGAGILSLTGTVLNSSSPGSTSINWQLKPLSGGLSVSPSGGSGLAPQSEVTFTGSVNGTGLQPGTQSATVQVAGQVVGTNQPITTRSTSVTIDPVYSRVINSVSPASFGRVMQGNVASVSSLTVTSTGARDDYTDLSMNVGSVTALSNTAGSFSGLNSTSTTYNGTVQTSSGLSVSASFAGAINGSVTGSFTLPGTTGLFTGEKLAAGTPSLPSLTISYSADVIAPRQLALTSPSAGTISVATPQNTGGFLYGAVIPLPKNTYVVNTLNQNGSSTYTSMVNVGNSSSGEADGAFTTSSNGSQTQVGQVYVTQTPVTSGGTVNVPVSVSVTSFGPTSGSASVHVITAEASTVNDTTAYPSLPIAYSVANVGYAAVGGTASNGNQLFGAPLTAPFSAGSAITSPIQSNVVATGSSGTASKATTYDFSTLQVKQLTGQTLTNADILGTVGSEADIPLSDAFSASTNVTMAWRARNQTENGSAWLVNSGANWAPIFKNTGAQWLTSDIVQVAGVPTTTSSASVFAYAMEMSYDNGINTSIEPGSINTVQGAYLAKALLDGNGNVTQWENAVDFDVIPAHTDVGADARTAYNGSLSSFISNYANPGGYSLDQLVGSWGVDTANQESWAIIDSGGGDFAVVPEPSTIALLAVAAGGLLLYGLRRRMRAASPAVA